MNVEPDPDLMFVYVAGVADETEAAACEAWLSSASPAAQAAFAEALAVFNAMPLGLTSVQPPVAVRHAVLGRIAANTADSSASAGPGFSSSSSATMRIAPDYATTLRWPIYLTSGLAACLAMALTVSIWNNRQMTSQAARMSSTLANSRDVLSSPYVTLARLQTQSQTDNQTYGRVLFCPQSRRYQVMVYGLKQLPPNKAYELWLISPDGQKVPAGTFAVSEDGTATVWAHAAQPIDAVNAAITDEPAAGSAQPTGSIHLIGALQASR